MKVLILMSVFLVSTITFAQGIERHDDGYAANKYTWSEIHNSATLKADSLGVVQPEGASIFNVCDYDENHFKVLNPGYKCLEYGYKNTGETRTGGRIIQEKVCLKKVKKEFELVSKYYNKCVETETVTEGQNRRNEIVTRKCVKYVKTPVPLQQEIDVYRDMKEYRFYFTKTYTVPVCGNNGKPLPDTDLPDIKE